MTIPVFRFSKLAFMTSVNDCEHECMRATGYDVIFARYREQHPTKDGYFIRRVFGPDDESMCHIAGLKGMPISTVDHPDLASQGEPEAGGSSTLFRRSRDS